MPLRQLTRPRLILAKFPGYVVEFIAGVQFGQCFFLFGVFLAEDVADVDGLGALLGFAAFVGAGASVFSFGFITAFAFWRHVCSWSMRLEVSGRVLTEVSCWLGLR